MLKSTIDPQEIAKFAEHASDWWNREGAFKTLHDINATRIAFIEHYANLNGARVLDVGCGGGILAEGMAARGAHVTGLDAESHAVVVAREHAQEEGYDIAYHCQALETFSAEPFEIITCMEMLEHVQQPSVIIEHCARLLAPGGLLFLSTINRTWQAYASVVLAAEYILQLLPKQTHDFAKFIKPSELASMTRAVGLSTLALSGLSYNPFTRAASLDKSVLVNYCSVHYYS